MDTITAISSQLATISMWMGSVLEESFRFGCTFPDKGLQGRAAGGNLCNISERAG